MFLNVGFFNALRSRTKTYDAYLFTPGSVQVVRYDDNRATYKNIGHMIDGDVTKDISGKFSLVWTAEGELVPLLGINEEDLSSESMHYTFGAYSAPTGLTPVPGQTDRFTLKTGVAGSITRPAIEPGQISYQIFKNVKDAIPAGEPVTVDAISGKIDLGSALTMGRHVYTVIVSNPTGVYGRYTITVDVIP